MDDLRSKPLFAAYCCLCCCLALPLMIASFVLMHYAYTSQKGYTNSVSNLGGNWKSDMIFGITNNPNVQLKAGQYVDRFKGRYPGNDRGCICEFGVSSFFWDVRQGLKHRSCNYTESMAGCQDIPSLPPRDLTRWYQNQEIYAIRQYNTSFLESYDKIDRDGNCVQGYKHCGDKNSISKGLCIRETLPECPLSDISNAPADGYTQTPFLQFTLYTSRDQNHNSLTDALIAEDHACFSREDVSITPGRDKYELINADYSLCTPDRTVIPLSEIGEADFFDLNGLDFRRLARWYVSNNYKYRLFAGRYVEWSPACADMMPEIQKIGEANMSLTSSFKVHYVLMWISFIGSLVMLLRYIQFHSDPTKYAPYGALFCVRSFCMVLVLPTTIICYLGTRKIGKFLTFVSTQNCSSESSNQMLKTVSESYNHKVAFYYQLFLWLGIGCFLVEIVMLVIRTRCHQIQLGLGHNQGNGNNNEGQAEMMGRYEPLSQNPQMQMQPATVPQQMPQPYAVPPQPFQPPQPYPAPPQSYQAPPQPFQPYPTHPSQPFTPPTAPRDPAKPMGP